MDTQPDPQRMTSEERKAWREAFFASLRDRPPEEAKAASRLAQAIYEAGQDYARRTLISAPLASGRDDSARTSGPASPPLAPPK